MPIPTDHPKLCDYVKTPMHRGRVTAVHHFCPESDDWLAQQVLLSREEREHKGPWLSVLVDGGGSITVPSIVAEVIDPFPLNNPWSDFCFRPDEP